MKSMRIIAMACLEYEIDFSNYPTASSVAELEELIVGIYVKFFDRNDAWGNEFEIHSTSEGFEIRSYGRDGERDDHPPAGLTDDLDADIVISDTDGYDMEFTQAPFEG